MATRICPAADVPKLSPGMVAIQMEMVHETRLIPTDGRAPIPAVIDHWLGESRGTWEDHNTLMVTTTNFRPGPSATNIGTSGSPRENKTPVSNALKAQPKGIDSAAAQQAYDVPHPVKASAQAPDVVAPRPILAQACFQERNFVSR